MEITIISIKKNPTKKVISVLIGIISWNNYQDTKECILSAKQMNFPNKTITVIDNASQDNSIIKLTKEFPDVKFINNQVNKGYAGGLNTCIDYGLQISSDFIVLTNNDVLFDKNYLKNSIKKFNFDEKIFIIGGKIYFFSQKNKVWSVGGKFNYFHARVDWFADDYPIDRGQFDRLKYVEIVSGCTFIINLKYIDEIGKLSERYFYRGEEWEYSYRIRKRGFKILYNPKAIIYHKINTSLELISPLSIYAGYRAKYLFAREIFPPFIFQAWKLLYNFLILFYSVKNFEKLSKRNRKHGLNKLEIQNIKLATYQAIYDDYKQSSFSENDLLRLKEKIL